MLLMQARLKLGHYLISSPVAGQAAPGEEAKPVGGGPLEVRRGDALMRAAGYFTAAANVLFVEPQFKVRPVAPGV